MTTASRKATAFSLIRMVGFPCFVVVGEPGRSAEGGERRPPRPAHHIHMFAQYSISHETENNSSPQSKKAITRAAGIAFVAAGSEAGSSRRGHQFRGGGGGGRVSFAACRRVARAVTGQEGQRGGELASPSSRQAGNRTVRPVSPAMRPCGSAQSWRGGSAPHRLMAKWWCAASNSNAKTPILVARIATN